MELRLKTAMDLSSYAPGCSAREIGFADLHYTECLSQNNSSCGFSLPFGNVVICRHPLHLKISALAATVEEAIPG